MTTATRDILSRLRTAPTVTLPKDTALIPAAIAIRKMMVERSEAADEIVKLRDALERLETENARLKIALRSTHGEILTQAHKLGLAVTATIDAALAADGDAS